MPVFRKRIKKLHEQQTGQRTILSSDCTKTMNACNANLNPLPNPPTGLIAGWGRFPVQVAQKLKDQGRPVVAVAITGHASQELDSICDQVLWAGVGKLGKHLRFFQRAGVKQVTMAGKLFKAELLYQGSVWFRHFPDLTCIRTLGPCLLGNKRDARDDQLLLAITSAYRRQGMEIFPATDIAPELLVHEGHLAGPHATKQGHQDTLFGWEIAKQMGGLDIGQAVTIKDGIVIAVEAIEGTDACISRTGELCKRGGWTLVKVSKPDQDMRFDVPTIGPQTVQNVSIAGGKTIAIEAHKTIVVDQELTFRLAEQLGVSIVSLESPQDANSKSHQTSSVNAA